jgi:hypothetical protein
MEQEQMDGLTPGQKVTVYTSNGKGHTGYVGMKSYDRTLTLRVPFSNHGEYASIFIPLAHVLYWTEYLNDAGDPKMGTSYAELGMETL